MRRVPVALDDADVRLSHSIGCQAKLKVNLPTRNIDNLAFEDKQPLFCQSGREQDVFYVLGPFAGKVL